VVPLAVGCIDRKGSGRIVASRENQWRVNNVLRS
jgi:hypothetical protein